MNCLSRNCRFSWLSLHRGGWFSLVVVFGIIATVKFRSSIPSVHFPNHDIKYDDESYRPNKTWKDMRKNLLSSRENTPKVIILAHARGGSTLISDIFKIEGNDTVMWYEALHAFHSYYSGLPVQTIDTSFLYFNNLTRKTLNSYKAEGLTNYLIQLLECDIKSLPIELFAHLSDKFSSSFDGIWNCMNRHTAPQKHNMCAAFLLRTCYSPEHLEMKVENSSISSSARCEEILRTIRSWKPQSIDGDTTRELIWRHAEKPYARRFGKLMDKSCNKLISSTEESVTRFPDAKQDIAYQAEELAELVECIDVLEKFSKFVEHYRCLKHLSESTYGCLQLLEPICLQRTLTVATVQRMFLADLEPVIVRMPDIRIVHYVRDPRAVAVSRFYRRLHVLTIDPDWSTVDEAVLLCRRMRYDTKEKLRLQQKYPESIITIRYEDLVLNPTVTVTRMYDYFGRPVPDKLQEWIETRLNASKDNGIYGVERANSRKHLTDWRSSMSENEIQQINALCLDVLSVYGYEL